jgi:hypothetical protein
MSKLYRFVLALSILVLLATSVCAMEYKEHPIVAKMVCQWPFENTHFWP